MSAALAGQIAVVVFIVSSLTLPVWWPPIARRIERNQEETERQARVRRLENLYDASVWITINEEIDRECVKFEEDLQKRAALILAQLDDEAAQNFAGEVEVAQAILEYRAAADGRRIA